jgi:hypothetical protein
MVTLGKVTPEQKENSQHITITFAATNDKSTFLWIESVRQHGKL